MAAKKKSTKRYRSAKTGRFVTAKYAKRHKATTVGHGPKRKKAKRRA